MTNEQKLLPCSCGAIPRAVDYPGSAIHVSCRCGLQLWGGRSHFADEAEAAGAWNTRAAAHVPPGGHVEEVLDMVTTAVAPVPAAGGEVEVLGWCRLVDGKYLNFNAWPLWQEEQKQADRYDYNIVKLVDQAHVTRLQAEVAALQARLTVADQRVDDATDLLQRAQQLIPELQYNWHANTKALLDSMKPKQ